MYVNDYLSPINCGFGFETEDGVECWNRQLEMLPHRN